MHNVTHRVDLRVARLDCGKDPANGREGCGAEVDASFPGTAILCDTVMPDGTVAGSTTGCEHR